MRTRAAFPALKLKRDGYMDHSTESQTDRKELKKTMSPAEVWALAVGAIIGWGCFVLPGTRFLPDAGPLGTCLAFLIGGGLLCTVALCYSILIKRMSGIHLAIPVFSKGYRPKQGKVAP